MKIIGLTGPIASGKNEVCRILQKRGAFIIDADKVAHELYSRGSRVTSQLVKEFGENIFNRKGEIDRKKLGEIVFSDNRKLKALNRIVHPYLKKEIIKIAEPRAAQSALIVINAAVLKEIGLLYYVDEVWVVMALKNIRLKRLMKAGLNKEQAQARLRSQISRKEYLEIADLVIENNSDLKALKGKIQKHLG
jgi:dephospho-CoA kinase